MGRKGILENFKQNRISILVVLAAVVVGGFLIIPHLNQKPEQTIEPLTAYEEKLTQNSDSNTATKNRDIKIKAPYGWKTFMNDKYHFAIAYPDVLRKTDNDYLKEPWIYSEQTFYERGYEKKSGAVYHIAFGPPKTGPGGLVWGVTVYKNVSIDDVINRHGDQFEDRQEKRQNIKVNNVDAIFITVTTAQYNDWISKAVIVQSNGFIYDISNGAEELAEYNEFYKSFTLIE